MSAPRCISGLVVLALALGACDVDGWLRARNVRAFREVEVREAQRLLAEGHGVLVEAVVSERSGRRVEAARPVTLDGALPGELVEEDAPLVVVADDVAKARHLAARLVRAGAAKVAVVRGGVAAWRERGEPGAVESTAVF